MLATIRLTSDQLIYISALLPLAIGLAVKRAHSTAFKAIVMLVATAAVALVKAVTDKGGIIDAVLFRDWARATVFTVATYYGVWNPLGLGNLAPTVGLPGPVTGTSGPVTPGEIPAGL